MMHLSWLKIFRHNFTEDGSELESNEEVSKLRDVPFTSCCLFEELWIDLHSLAS